MATSTAATVPHRHFGIVLIGRNEGERLVACLRSLPEGATCVYVDSGSTDRSVAEARSRGIEVTIVKATHFSAGHARNEGVRRLLEIDASLEFIQFLDGDCVLQSGWLEAAIRYLDNDGDCAIVCGRRREIAPQRSVFNRLCDLEWDTPVGPTASCGGDALVRTTAFLDVGGFRDEMIAGEEPELCVRLRQRGWRIVRLDAEMTRHDAAMTRGSQWWKRAARAGHAFAEGSALHPTGSTRLWQRESRSIVVWGAIVPLLIASLAIIHPAWLLLFAIYPVLVIRVFLQAPRRWTTSDRALYAFACVAAKFPQAQGFARYHVNRLLKRRSQIIEYKNTVEATP